MKYKFKKKQQNFWENKLVKYNYSNLQGENPKVFSYFFKLLKYHIIFSVSTFSFISSFYFSFDFNYTSFFSEIIPATRNGKEIIIKNSNNEFYNISGILLFISNTILFSFFIFYLKKFLSYKISLRTNRNDKLNDYIFIFFILSSFFIIVEDIFGPYIINDYGIINNAIYRGEYLLGLLIPITITPFLLFIIFAGIVYQFLVLTNRSESKRR